MLGYASKDARKVIDHLEGLGVDISSSDHYHIEYACSSFYPNHIVGVIQKILSGKGRLAKLEKAQDQGWAYFNQPVFSMLLTRSSARRKGGDIRPPDEHSKMVFRMVVSRLLSSDIGTDEMRLVLVDLPNAVSDRVDLAQAIKGAREQGKHSVHYLAAILKRKAGERAGMLRDTMEARGGTKPWVPDVGKRQITDEEMAEMEQEWEDHLEGLEMRVRFEN